MHPLRTIIAGAGVVAVGVPLWFATVHNRHPAWIAAATLAAAFGYIFVKTELK